MTLLQVMPEDDGARVLLRTGEASAIGAALAEFGIRFEQWPTVSLAEHAGPAEVLACYRSEVDTVMAQGPYPIVDVAAISPDDANAEAARSKFLNEHVHDEDEVRFFVSGAGCFYLHLDREVYAVVCRAGDLMSVPAGTAHWFDMGSRPSFRAIRFFKEEDGWIADFTGDPISARMPTLDELLAPVGGGR